MKQKQLSRYNFYLGRIFWCNLGKKMDLCKDAARAVGIIDGEWLMRYDKRIQPLSLWGGECNRISGE